MHASSRLNTLQFVQSHKIACNIEIPCVFPAVGTVFVEVWKRKNATLAYEWDVDNWEDAEPDRPQFYGLQQKPVGSNLINS